MHSPVTRAISRRTCLVPGKLWRLSTQEGDVLLRTFVNETDARKLAHILLHLREFQFPCQRLLDHKSNEVITEFIPGVTLDTNASLSQLKATGTLLARLHAIPVNDTLPAAQMLPEEELKFAYSCLQRAGAENLTGNLIENIKSFPSLAHLPRCIIHNDIHLGNVIMGGERLSFIDWEGAGLGPSIIDVGFLLSSVYPRSLFHVLEERVRAILSGYLAVRKLEEIELEFLLPAIEFRPLVFLSALALKRSNGEEEDKALSEWFLARYTNSSLIAAIAGDIISSHFR